MKLKFRLARQNDLQFLVQLNQWGLSKFLNKYLE